MWVSVFLLLNKTVLQKKPNKQIQFIQKQIQTFLGEGRGGTRDCQWILCKNQKETPLSSAVYSQLNVLKNQLYHSEKCVFGRGHFTKAFLLKLLGQFCTFLAQCLLLPSPGMSSNTDSARALFLGPSAAGAHSFMPGGVRSWGKGMALQSWFSW